VLKDPVVFVGLLGLFSRSPASFADTCTHGIVVCFLLTSTFCTVEPTAGVVCCTVTFNRVSVRIELTAGDTWCTATFDLVSERVGATAGVVCCTETFDLVSVRETCILRPTFASMSGTCGA
jgi:hypothetical protein